MANARRGFLKSLAAAPLLPAALVHPQAAPAPPAAPPSSPSPGESPPSPAADALGEAVRHRYGAQLGPGDLEEIKKAIEGNLQAADRLRKALALGNPDEPVTLFQARPPGPARAAARVPAPRPRRRG